MTSQASTLYFYSFIYLRFGVVFFVLLVWLVLGFVVGFCGLGWFFFFFLLFVGLFVLRLFRWILCQPAHNLDM